MGAWKTPTAGPPLVLVILGTAYVSGNIGFGVEELTCQFWVRRPKSKTDPSFALGCAVQLCPTCPTHSGFTVGLPLSLFHQKHGGETGTGLSEGLHLVLLLPLQAAALSPRHPHWLLRSKEGITQQIGAH